jgi:hypothetical protein
MCNEVKKQQYEGIGHGMFQVTTPASVSNERRRALENGGMATATGTG